MIHSGVVTNLVVLSVIGIIEQYWVQLEDTDGQWTKLKETWN